MAGQSPYIRRPQAEEFLNVIATAMQHPTQHPVLFHLHGIGGVGKTVLLQKLQENHPGAAVALISFGWTASIETPIKLIKKLHEQLEQHFQPPPPLKRDVRELRPKPDPFLTLYNQYFDTVHQLQTESLDGRDC